MNARYALLAAALAALSAPGCKKEEPVAPPPTQTGTPPIPGPMGSGPMPGTNPTQLIQSGMGVYRTHCAGCHGSNGKGTRPGQPDFTNAAWFATHTDAELMEYVRAGIKGKMPSFETKLDPNARQAVVAYLRTIPKAVK